jgi:pyruvate/2-oxoglutarate dehydrogenase complex dihydrolipoamide dehydrogenase (E3) component
MSLDWKILKEQRDNYIKRLNLIYEDLLKENKMTYIKGLG